MSSVLFRVGSAVVLDCWSVRVASLVPRVTGTDLHVTGRRGRGARLVVGRRPRYARPVEPAVYGESHFVLADHLGHLRARREGSHGHGLIPHEMYV